VANQVEILVKATDEASSVLEQFKNNADTALKGATASAGDTAAGMEAAGASVALMAGAITAAITGVVLLAHSMIAATSAVLDYAESLEKANLSTGLSVGFIQKLIQTGDEMGISWDRTRMMVERMEKTLETNAAGLLKLGIVAKDFEGLSADEAFRKMAVQVMAIEDPILRGAAAQVIFNKSGAEAIPLLAAVVSGAADAQRALGTDTVAALGRAEAATDRTATAWKFLKTELAASLALHLPLEAFFNNLATGIAHLSELGKAIGMVASGNYAGAVAFLEGARAVEQFAAQQAKATQEQLKNVEAQRQQVIASGLAAKQAAEQEKAEAKLTATRAKAAKEVEAAWLKSNKEIADDLAARTRQHVDRYKEDTAAALTEVERRIAAEKKLATEVLRSRERMEEADANYFQRVIDGASRSSDTQIEQAKRVLAEVLARRAEMLAAHEETNASMLKSDEALAAAKKTLDEAELKLKIQHFTMIADSASSILRSLFGKSKAAAIVAALIDAAMAIVKCFAQFGFWGFIPAAAVAVATGVEIAKIKNAEPAGFAQGTPGTSFVDFGAGTPTVLHGQEAVITQEQGETLAEMLEEAIKRANRQSGGGQPGGRPIRIDNHIHLDGREIGYDMSRRSRAGLLPLRVS